MSLGYGGYVDLVQADDTLVIYAYCCYNINLLVWFILFEMGHAVWKWNYLER